MDRMNEFYASLKRGNCIDSDLDGLLRSVAIGSKEFSMLYRLIAHTRDINDGLGERDLTYAMICVWYRHHPVHAIKALRFIVTSVGIGSWADIKYLCGYVVRTKDPNADAIIDSAIGLMNYQLNVDRVAWNNALVNYLQIKRATPNTLVPRPSGRDVMSFAAKWAPREKSRFGWLFNRMVVQWLQMFGGNVSEKSFRKMISMLNRELETVQIKQCAGKWADIGPETVSICTLLRQKKAFTQVHTEDRALCASNFSGFYDTAVIAIPAGKLVAYALAKDRDESWLNHVWKMKPKLKPSNAIPIIDIGWQEINYDLIGQGIGLAQTGPQRFMLAGQVPIWITATYEDTFIDIIDRIRPFTEQRTLGNVETAISLLDQASFITGFKNEYVVMGKTEPKDVATLFSGPRPDYLEMDL
jgi:hypothetical protein